MACIVLVHQARFKDVMGGIDTRQHAPREDDVITNEATRQLLVEAQSDLEATLQTLSSAQAQLEEERTKSIQTASQHQVCSSDISMTLSMVCWTHTAGYLSF